MVDSQPKPTRRILKTQRIVLKNSTTLRHRNITHHGVSTPVQFPSWLVAIMKLLILDVPLATLFLLFLGTNALLYLNYKIWFPWMAQNQWTEARAAMTEQTYHHKESICEASSVVTAKNYEELLISAVPLDDMSKQDGAKVIREHGAGIFSNILTNKADIEAFREFSLEKNRRLGNDEGPVDVVGVIENRHRWSFAFEVNEHPSIGRLLTEIGQHKVLKACLEGLLGPNPSIIELSTITAEHGAKSQGWHFDTSEKGDSLKYANTFSDLYSLLIPVQATTAEMGATAVCPGTHYCPQFTGCGEHGFQAVDNNGVWAAGDGLLFNSHVGHQGTAHIKGPPRVAIVISFASRPFAENKLLPLAAGYIIPWSSMGFNFEDLEKAPTTMVPPWSTLRSLGLSRLFDSTSNRQNTGWDYFCFCASHMANFDDPPQVVLMPYIKLLPLFLLGQAHRHPIYSPWQAFVVDTLQNIWVFSLVLYVAGLTVYLQVLAAFDNEVETKKQFLSSRRSLWARLLVSQGLAFMLVLVIVQHYVGEYDTSLRMSHEIRSTQEL